MALQFPTRSLDKHAYSHKLDGHFPRFNKPVVVNEAEFALSDQLYPVAPIVGGPNGQSISKNYEKALNDLVPTFESFEIRKQRERIRTWLMKETKSGNAEYTADTPLSIPGVNAETAKKLSTETGMVVIPDASSEPLSDQVTAKVMALQAINAITSNRRATPRGMTRMEYSDPLMQAYLNDRKEWESQRDIVIGDAAGKAGTDPQGMEEIKRRLAHITAIKEAELSSQYADAAVRGDSHTVRGFMDRLDIKGSGESLQDAKDSLRESALSSVYAASKVYPVDMQPNDWFEALDTGFTREDLTQDVELIAAAVETKSKYVDTLEAQIANLRAFNKGDAVATKKNMDAAAKDREDKTRRLNQAYSASTISAIKMAIAIATSTMNTAGASTAAVRGAADILKGIVSEENTDATNRNRVLAFFAKDSPALKDIGDQIDSVQAANNALLQASRLMTESMGEYASATAADTRTGIDNLQRQLTNAKAELAELQERFTIAKRAPTTTGSLDEIGKMPQENEGSRWSEIHIESKASNSHTSISSTNQSSVSSFGCNFWIGSHSSNSASDQAKTNSSSMAKDIEFKIDMHTTYVTVDRSAWFDPSLLEMSGSFTRGANAENYTKWSDWGDSGRNFSSVKEAAEAITTNASVKPSGYLAAYPVGYVLVKDCVIRIPRSANTVTSFKKHFDQDIESSDGILCFSHNSASKSSGDSSGPISEAATDGIVVRIPGPQILGYIMQVTPPDVSLAFQPTPGAGLFVNDL